jgi:NAD(P)-dependent dehydrogenase (short-subunit alcohol dehydrogenase family)
MDLQLAGKRALVTGSSSGIGRAIASVLAAEGVEVFAHGRDRARVEETAAIIRDAGGKAHVTVGNLATDEGAAAVAEAVHAVGDGVDILVNNVGSSEGSGGAKPGWFDVIPDYWVAATQINLVGAVRMIHAFAPAMRERGWGRIINVASAGATAPTLVVPDYCAAKAALLNMTVGLSKSLARTGVTVNAVSPGTTRTVMMERAIMRAAAAHGWPEGISLDEGEQRLLDLGNFPCNSVRYGRPEEIGALIAFMSSPISGFINGANYRIDGGQVQSIN